MRDRSLPSLDFLLDASMTSLQDLELAALNRSANLGKGVRSELEAWIEQHATAMLARWMMDNRELLLRGVSSERKQELRDFLEAVRSKKTA